MTDKKKEPTTEAFTSEMKIKLHGRMPKGADLDTVFAAVFAALHLMELPLFSEGVQFGRLQYLGGGTQRVRAVDRLRK